MWRCLVTDQKSWNYSTLVHEHFEIFCKSAKHPHTLDVFYLPCYMNTTAKRQSPNYQQPQGTSRRTLWGDSIWDRWIPMAMHYPLYGKRAIISAWLEGQKNDFFKKKLLSGMLFDKISSTLNYASRPSRFSCLINHTYHKVNQRPIKIHTRLSLGSSSTLLSWIPQSTTKGHHRNCATNCLNFSCKHRTVGTTERILSWGGYNAARGSPCTHPSSHSDMACRQANCSYTPGIVQANTVTPKNHQKYSKILISVSSLYHLRGLLLPLNQLRARQWVCLFCLRQLQMLDSPATCPSPCHSQITNLQKAQVTQVVLLHDFWERF